MQLFRLSAFLVVMVLAANAAAQTITAPVSLAEIPALNRTQSAAEATYLALLEKRRSPPSGLMNLRSRLADADAAILDTIELRRKYSTGEIVVPGPHADATRSRIVGVLSNKLVEQEVESRRIARAIADFEESKIEGPLRAAREAFEAATLARDDALGRAEALLGPLAVESFRVRAPSGRVILDATWRLKEGEESREEAVVRGLEKTLAAVQADIAALRQQVLALAQEFYAAGVFWNHTLQSLIERGETDARLDIGTQIFTDALEVTVGVTTGGTWTAARVMLAGVDLSLRGHSYYARVQEWDASLASLSQERVSEELKARLASRIREDIAARRKPDLERLIRGHDSPVVPTVLQGSDILGGASIETIKTSVATLNDYFENEGRALALAKTPPPDWFASLWMTSRVNTNKPDRALAQLLSRPESAAEYLSAEAGNLGFSLALIAAREATAPILQQILYGFNAPSTETLIRQLANQEVRMYATGEAYRQTRLRYEAQAAVEPVLIAELAAARHRLAVESVRELLIAPGKVVDRGRPIEIDWFKDRWSGRTVVAVDVSVTEGRVPWRAELVQVSSGGSQIVGAAEAGIGVKSARIIADIVGEPEESVVDLRLRLVSGNAGEQDFDMDGASVAVLDPRSLAWHGWEAGPDVYPLRLLIGEDPMVGYWLLRWSHSPARPVKVQFVRAEVGSTLLDGSSGSRIYDMYTPSLAADADGLHSWRCLREGRRFNCLVPIPSTLDRCVGMPGFLKYIHFTAAEDFRILNAILSYEYALHEDCTMQKIDRLEWTVDLLPDPDRLTSPDK